MKLHFPWQDIEKLFEEICTATTAHPLYGDETGKGFWLVGDQGVYLMANTTDGVHHSKLGPNDRRPVVYARECNPDTMEFDDWWETKHRSFGGDDGVEFLDLGAIQDLAVHHAVRKDKLNYLVIDLTPHNFRLSIVE